MGANLTNRDLIKLDRLLDKEEAGTLTGSEQAELEEIRKKIDSESGLGEDLGLDFQCGNL